MYGCNIRRWPRQRTNPCGECRCWRWQLNVVGEGVVVISQDVVTLQFRVKRTRTDEECVRVKETVLDAGLLPQQPAFLEQGMKMRSAERVVCYVVIVSC